MKEIDHNDRLSEKQGIEVSQKKQEQIQYHYEGSIKPRKGHRIWEINPDTLEVAEAEIKTEAQLKFGEDMDAYLSNPKVNKKKGFVYISALNQKSALKRFKKNKGSAKLPIETKPLISFTP